jgi:phosphate transport system permease protein
MLLGVVLALSRALAETSALLFTSGYSDRLPESLFDSGRVLSIHILDLAMNVTGGDQNAYASGVVLIVFLLLINTLFTASFRLYRKMI